MKYKFQNHTPAKFFALKACLPTACLVAHSVSKSTWKWVLCMEVSPVECTGIRYSDQPQLQSTKVGKYAITCAFTDDSPSLDVASPDLDLHSIRTMFEVFNNAAAMCEAAHLASLKSHSQIYVVSYSQI